jgi:pimeloyl-ACP methyl ester carboxylesterase
VEIVEGAGHFLHLERPDDVQGRVLAWLGEASA